MESRPRHTQRQVTKASTGLCLTARWLVVRSMIRQVPFYPLHSSCPTELPAALFALRSCVVYEIGPLTVMEASGTHECKRYSGDGKGMRAVRPQETPVTQHNKPHTRVLLGGKNPGGWLPLPGQKQQRTEQKTVYVGFPVAGVWNFPE